MADDSAVLLVCSWKEPRNVNEGNDGYVECVEEADEPRCLCGCVDIEAPSESRGVVGDDSYGPSLHSGEAGDDVLGVVGHDLVEVTVVDDLLDYLSHVVGDVGIVGDKVLEGREGAVGRVSGRLSVGE